MPCCGKDTTGKVPEELKKDESQPPPEKIKEITPNKSENPTIKYSITIKTGNSPKSGTEGPVYIQIFGTDNKQTEDLLLTNPNNDKSFPQDSIKNIQVQAIDIGKPQRIIIRHEDETNGWYIDYVEILVHDNLIRFIANRWLNDQELSAELTGSEQQAVSYDIEVQTGSEQIDSFDSPVYIQIYGTTTETPKTFLESTDASFDKGSKAKFNISSDDVGEIQKIVIGHEARGTVNDWYLQSVKVQTSTQQQEFTVNKWLSPTKDDKQLFIVLNREAPRPASPPPSMYFVTIQTGDVRRAEDIQMSIHGSNGQTARMVLKDHAKSKDKQLFQKGNSDQFEIKHKDIGNIESITIGFDDNEPEAAWLLEDVDIKYKETVYHFQAQCWLSSRLGSTFNWITIKPDTNTDDINYKVIIETGESGIDANIILCIYGDKNTTKSFALRTTKDDIQAKFDKNTRLEFDLKANDVGKIKKINIGHDGEGTDQHWFLKSIKIEKNDEHYIFKADKYLSEEKDDKKTFIDLLPEEQRPPSPKKDQANYKITIATSSENDAGTDAGVFMIIYGEKDRTKTFQLKTTKQGHDASFDKGKTNEFEMELDDVGIIKKINIGQDGKGLHPSWQLETIQIQKGSEIYKFNTNKTLDQSTSAIDLTPIPSAKSPSPKSSRSVTPETKETIYKVSMRTTLLQQDAIDSDANFYMIIVGENGQTKRMPLPIDRKNEIELKTTDVGKIKKIILGQDDTENGVTWHVDSIIIKRGSETTTFNVDRTVEPNSEIELTPSALLSERSKNVVKMKDTNYEIKTNTGERAFEETVLIKIRGEYGLISIPLSKTKSGEPPFQSKAIDDFTCRTTDVGQIKRITLEHNGTKKENIWHLKKIKIIKGNEVYNFKADIRLDHREQKVNLYPINQKKEDYVQTELRRLRENLRTESFKMRRPAHKAHEPFVYNDLSPYFDTSSVEKAIYEPLETPPGYYTRVTALRIVEPWEAYGMDYGVNYELLKQRKGRGQSAKRSTTNADEAIDRTQGSTHLPEYPCVSMQKPLEYQRPLTVNDVSKIRSLVRDRYTVKTQNQIEKDYKRTRDDFYRMQLDNVAGYHPSNRENMVRVYHSYLENTPGSKKALHELCDQISLNATKTAVEASD